MNMSLLPLNDQVYRRPWPVDQMWSWAFAARVAALQPLLAAPLNSVCCFDWIEREMAWACEDLEDAGATPISLDLPIVFDLPTADADDALHLVTELLTQVAGFEINDIDDLADAQACQDAARRAQVCLAALAEVSHQPMLKSIAA